MARNTHGGGSQTNTNGLQFEQETNLENAIKEIEGYTITNNNIYFNSEYIGITAPKNKLYKLILEPNEVDYKEILSKQLLPDEALYIDKLKTIFIIEKKFQNGSGSVDEKLQTCEFKKLQYQRLFKKLNIKVEYLYVLNSWFQQPQYRDVLAFINAKGCHYFFNEIPLAFLGLI